MIHTRLGCSTISFRHLPLPQALAAIAELGFAEIDLGALPGVCDHVPYVLDAAAVADVAATVAASGLRVRSINGDIGDLNAPLDAEAERAATGTSTMLVALAAATGARGTGAALRRARPQPDRHTRADLDRVAAELVAAAAHRRRPRRASCGPNRCTSTGCASTSNARSTHRAASTGGRQSAS